MTDTTLSQALQEAYASAPVDVFVHYTLELIHPAFTTPIRVVRGRDALEATLEATAPVNPGALAYFVGFAFDFTKPELSFSGVPQVTIEIDNVERDIVASLELAVSAGATPITCIYREYLSTDLSGPQNNPPLTLTISTVKADVFKVTATASFPDLNNRRFPVTEYDAETYPGLVS